MIKDALDAARHAWLTWTRPPEIDEFIVALNEQRDTAKMVIRRIERLESHAGFDAVVDDILLGGANDTE